MAKGTALMSRDDRLVASRFPRSSRYHPEWVIKNSMGSNVLWMAEWLTAAMDLTPGMRVLDLGCGRAASSIFLAREFGVQVWATDLWISASENLLRIADAGLQDRVFPIHADARALPYAGEFFDAIISLDSYSYYGTDDLYLNYLAYFVKANGQIGIAGAGLVREIEGGLPDHLNGFWTQDFWCLHSAPWWRRLWERTGIIDIEVAEAMPEGWKVWLQWQQTAHPGNSVEITAIEADGGQILGYVRLLARRRADAKLETYCWPDSMRSFPLEYEQKPVLRQESL
jgi:SAM-dependent methyltransferase